MKENAKARWREESREGKDFHRGMGILPMVHVPMHVGRYAVRKSNRDSEGMTKTFDKGESLGGSSLRSIGSDGVPSYTPAYRGSTGWKPVPR